MKMRQYLPYKSAREYQDRGMAKWQGFFISEHTNILLNEKTRESDVTNLNLPQRLYYLNQLYLYQLKGKIRIYKKNHYEEVIGVPRDLNHHQVYVETENGGQWIDIEVIRDVQLLATEE